MDLLRKMITLEKKLQDLTMNDIYKYNQTILFIMIEQHYYILMEL